jgi:hypothetical protein
LTFSQGGVETPNDLAAFALEVRTEGIVGAGVGEAASAVEVSLVGIDEASTQLVEELLEALNLISEISETNICNGSVSRALYETFKTQL